jgi:hypothetical protein
MPRRSRSGCASGRGGARTSEAARAREPYPAGGGHVSGNNRAVGERLRDRLPPPVDVEHAVDLDRVVLHGVGGDAETLGDLLVGESFRQQLQNLHLAVGERVSGRRERPDALPSTRSHRGALLPGTRGAFSPAEPAREHPTRRVGVDRRADVRAGKLGGRRRGGLCQAVEPPNGRPTSIVLIPAIVLLVSGSIGFRGLAAIAQGEVALGERQFLQMFVVAATIAAGLLVGNTLVRPKVTLWARHGQEMARCPQPPSPGHRGSRRCPRRTRCDSLVA